MSNTTLEHAIESVFQWQAIIIIQAVWWFYAIDSSRATGIYNQLIDLERLQ